MALILIALIGVAIGGLLWWGTGIYPSRSVDRANQFTTGQFDSLDEHEFHPSPMRKP